MSSAEPTTEAEAAPAVDEDTQALFEELSGALGDAVVGSEQRAGDLWLRVRPDAWLRTAETLSGLGFDYFCFLSGIDWMPSAPNAEDAEAASVEPDADAEDAPDAEAAAEGEEPEPSPAGAEATEVTTPTGSDAEEGWETGFAGGETRFQVLARLYSTTRKRGATLKADLDNDAPRVESWVPVYRGADWHERETWEMFGFEFLGHPGLRHLYLPGEFEGFPLRKDFPLLSREVKPWPGLVDVEPMPETDAPAEEGEG